MAIRLPKDLSELELLSLIPISYSRLNTYTMCQAKYWFKYIVKLDEVYGAPAKLGNIVHSVLENKLEAERPVDKEDEQDWIHELHIQVQEHDPDREFINGKHIAEGETMMREFLDRHDGDRFQIHDKEMYFEVVLGKGLFRGYIDRVDVSHNMVTITDYKSGKREVTYDGAKDDLQLGLYALVARHFFPGKKVHAELYYLRTGRQKGHTFSDSDLDVVESRLIQLVDSVVDTDNFNPTKEYWPCTFCDFAKNGECTLGAKRTSGR